MVGYKLSKNDWITPFFVIFRSVREILLVTVFFDHPVAVQVASVWNTYKTRLDSNAPFLRTMIKEKRHFSGELRLNDSFCNFVR